MLKRMVKRIAHRLTSSHDRNSAEMWETSTSYDTAIQ
jgi:hypothetical protein